MHENFSGPQGRKNDWMGCLDRCRQAPGAEEVAGQSILDIVWLVDHAAVSSANGSMAAFGIHDCIALPVSTRAGFIEKRKLQVLAQNVWTVRETRRERKRRWV